MSFRFIVSSLIDEFPIFNPKTVQALKEFVHHVTSIEYLESSSCGPSSWSLLSLFSVA